MYYFGQDISTASAPIPPASLPPANQESPSAKPKLGIMGYPMLITAIVIYLWTRYKP